MAWITEALGVIAAQLTAAGVPATLDTRTLNLPGAWITAGPFTLDRLGNTTRQLDAQVWLVARDTGPTSAIDTLTDMLELIIAAGVPVGAVTPQSISLPNHAGDPLPGFGFTLPLEYRVDPITADPFTARRRTRK